MAGTLEMLNRHPVDVSPGSSMACFPVSFVLSMPLLLLPSHRLLSPSSAVDSFHDVA